ncbi:MAG: GNAT family N-acetyltransferase, partial [Planctomycetota bacterium]
DGTPVTLRPLTPEDEPKWHAMLGTCSEQTIRQRFFATIKSFTHEMAARYCFIDYDRELAIVAEFEKPGGGSELLGVGRLSADPDRSTAEFAVLVADPWQRKGLGLLLTDYCLGIANDWGVPYITSVTTSDNDGMRAIYDEFGFETKLDEANQLLTAEKRV